MDSWLLISGYMVFLIPMMIQVPADDVAEDARKFLMLYTDRDRIVLRHGLVIGLQTRLITDPITQYVTDLKTCRVIDKLGNEINPSIGTKTDRLAGLIVDPDSGFIRDPQTGIITNPENCRVTGRDGRVINSGIGFFINSRKNTVTNPIDGYETYLRDCRVIQPFPFKDIAPGIDMSTHRASLKVIDKITGNTTSITTCRVTDKKGIVISEGIVEHVPGSERETLQLAAFDPIIDELRTMRNMLSTRKIDVEAIQLTDDTRTLTQKERQLSNTIESKCSSYRPTPIEFGEDIATLKLTETEEHKLTEKQLEVEKELQLIRDDVKKFKESNGKEQDELRVIYTDYKDLWHLTLFKQMLESSMDPCSATPRLELPVDLKQFFDTQESFDYFVKIVSSNELPAHLESTLDELVEDAFVYVQSDQKTCLKSPKNKTTNEQALEAFEYIQSISHHAYGPNTWKLMCMIKNQRDLPQVPKFSQDLRRAIRQAVKTHVKGLNMFIFQNAEEITEEVTAMLEANASFSEFLFRMDYYQSCTRCLVRREVWGRLKALQTPAMLSPTSIVVICILGAIIVILLIVVARIHLLRPKKLSVEPATNNI